MVVNEENIHGQDAGPWPLIEVSTVVAWFCAFFPSVLWLAETPAHLRLIQCDTGFCGCGRSDAAKYKTQNAPPAARFCADFFLNLQSAATKCRVIGLYQYK
jgi:hypothetical protein